jgi:tyrosyl-tRNA synthetase
MEKEIESGDLHPRDAKRRLARQLVARYTSEKTALKAEQEFDQIFLKKDVPDEMESYELPDPVALVELMASAGLAKSKSEARRLIQGGGVSLDGEKIQDIDHVVAPDGETVLKVGKRKFLRLVARG